MTDILALDLATTTGWARGDSDGKPVSGSVNFRDSDPNAVFAGCMEWLGDFLEPAPRPELIVLEAMLPPDALPGLTSRAVRDRLAGLHGIARAIAFRRGCRRIEAVTVGKVRQHFLGTSRMPRVKAKTATMARCRMLGWECADDNAADALALFSYACGMLRPETALRVTPMFNPDMR